MWRKILEEGYVNCLLSMCFRNKVCFVSMFIMFICLVLNICINCMLVLFQSLLISSEPRNSRCYYSPIKPLVIRGNIIGNKFYQGHCIVGDIPTGLQFIYFTTMRFTTSTSYTSSFFIVFVIPCILSIFYSWYSCILKMVWFNWEETIYIYIVLFDINTVNIWIGNPYPSLATNSSSFHEYEVLPSFNESFELALMPHVYVNKNKIEYKQLSKVLHFLFVNELEMKYLP